MEIQKTMNRALVGAGALVLASASHAAAIDVGDIVSDIAAQAAPVALIGGAVLLLVVGIKAFQWVRKALS
ncbi:major capsid protein [Comamonas granuli]|uniref:major capsid protein n=1 Tax=Comamonas granuli TaxID=290309 RepID=UPI00069461E7|nr:major capsid protein [Comamonas granuli]